MLGAYLGTKFACVRSFNFLNPTLPLNSPNTLEEIDRKWQQHWLANGTYRTPEPTPGRPKYYVLDMFPYPSGAGLHVGHPLGYIASDVIARQKRMQGFAVLHPMGFDAFGLPAEQYAIQTGQHPQITTTVNAQRYRDQLQRIGFSFDWERQISTCDPTYYRWTQWMFLQLYDSWFDLQLNRARPIDELTKLFTQGGSSAAQAKSSDHAEPFSAEAWNKADSATQSRWLMAYRLAYRAMARVNWCPALGTVLANDEVKDGFSERGGHPVEQRMMPQWMLRISAYADRLLDELPALQWSESIKDHQRNWIGKSEGAQVYFQIQAGQGSGSSTTLEVFTTRPDTLFGVSFLVIAPEHPQLKELTTAEQHLAIEGYLAEIQGRSERERQAETKKISGCFTGSYAIHPLTGQPIPVWTADYVLAGYGTGAIMAVPAGDERDWNFARHFGLPVPGIFVGQDPNQGACVDKSAILQESSFLDGLTGSQGIAAMILHLQELGLGRGITRYRLRDAVFSRQRYWGEPVPVAIEHDEVWALPDTALPLILPEIELYLPTAEGEPPLARATDWTYQGKPLETTTMPGWAGSSWYFLRYMDPTNEAQFADPQAMDYWGPVDLYIGGSEHATGHLLYARFWNHFLYDRGWVPFREPFTKLVNQGMIQGISEYVFRSQSEHGLDFWMSRIHNILQTTPNNSNPLEGDHRTQTFRDVGSKLQERVAEFSQIFLSEDLILALKRMDSSVEKFGYRSSVDIRFVDRNRLNIPRLLSDPAEGLAFQHALWLGLEGCSMQGNFYSWNHAPMDLSETDFFHTKPEVEKMSKSKRNVVNPDSVIDQYGADTLRLYELFLGPLEDAKPWDTQGIEGVSRFLQKAWRYYRQTPISDTPPSEAALKILHRCIKKISDGMDRMALNTCVSGLMIGLNEIQSASIQHRDILRDYALLLAPFAPHLGEELWSILGFEPSIHHAPFPVWNAQYLEEDTFAYPVQQNGKLRFQIDLPSKATSAELTQMALEHPRVIEWLAGRQATKIIAVPGRILNFVLPN